MGVMSWVVSGQLGGGGGQLIEMVATCAAEGGVQVSGPGSGVPVEISGQAQHLQPHAAAVQRRRARPDPGRRRIGTLDQAPDRG